jgi:hypothetical protein
LSRPPCRSAICTAVAPDAVRTLRTNTTARHYPPLVCRRPPRGPLTSSNVTRRPDPAKVARVRSECGDKFRGTHVLCMYECCASDP